MFITPPPPQRLPTPYRAEEAVVTSLLAPLQTALDWAAAAQMALPWVQAVRQNPPPFWAMESLLKEYPISSAEGLGLMRLAEALLRVPDIETAIALTADQLGRANFEAGGDKALARLASSAIGLSKKFLPDEGGNSGSSGLLGKMGARTVVAATLRAVQLLGRQFVLGQTIGKAMDVANTSRKKKPLLRFSYDMLGEGARTEADALKYLASYTNAIESIAAYAHFDSATELNDGISIKLSALHPRYEDAQRSRVMAELVPRVWALVALAARANINLTIDAEEVNRLELSLEVFEALAAKVAEHYPAWQGLGLAMQAYQTRALDLVEHIIALARKYKLRLMCRLVKGAYWDSEIKRAQELGLPHYPVFTHKHHTDIAYLACAQALLDAPDAVYPQFAGHNAATIAAILQMASKAPTFAASHAALPPEGAGLARGGPSQAAGEPSPLPSPDYGRGSKSDFLPRPFGERAGGRGEPVSRGAKFELQRLHGMGEGIFREVLKNPDIACRVYAPVGSHRDLLAYLVRRLLENGANSSFVHQLADESVGMGELLLSPLHVNACLRCHCLTTLLASEKTAPGLT